MLSIPNLVDWILGSLLIVSSAGVLLFPKPVHACLSFLLSLIILAALYIQLSAEFIAIMQVFVYAGAILVIFMFVVILFQDAHDQIEHFQPQSSFLLIFAASAMLLTCWMVIAAKLRGLGVVSMISPEKFGSARSLGHALYEGYFFPFEAVTLLFLIAVVGALYIAKRRIK